MTDTQEIKGTVTAVGNEVKIQVYDDWGHTREFILDTYTWEEMVRPKKTKFNPPPLVTRLIKKEEFPVEVRNV